jgi:DNA-binding CsgD family transcriptional regulator
MSSLIKIMIAEPSDIVFNGMYSIINDIEINTEILRHNSSLVLSDEINKFNPDIIIIDPIIDLAHPNTLYSIFNEFKNTAFITVVSIYSNSDVIQKVANTFSICDNDEFIKGIILKVINSLSEQNTTHNSNLSEREIDVLKLVALGMSNKEIAEKLFISIHTVISHRKNITQKLGIKSVAGLVTYVTVNNILDINTLESLQQ